MVLSYYYPHWTGLTAYAQREAEGLVRRGHQVTVLTARFRDDLAPEEVHNGVRIVRLRRLLRISRGPVQPAFPWVANRLVREHDVVQMHGPLMEAPMVTGLAGLHKRPAVFTDHGDLVMPAGFFNQVVEKVVTAMMSRALRQSARITIHSKDYADHSRFLAPFQDKLAYIYPPVEIPAPIPEQVAAWRRELGAERLKLVGFAGRFVEEKGYDYLLKAIPSVVERVPEARFVYAGEHRVAYEPFYEKWHHLWQRWQDYLIMVGLILERQKMANFYGMLDVLALPSRTDCFPSVQIEAMMCGTPVVATDIPGGRVPVQVTGMGRLVRPRDERALADGLVQVLQERPAYVKPRQEIKSVFGLERSIDEYETLLRSLV